MRILVVGAGAIGGITGGYLTRAGEDVTLVDRNEAHVRAMQTDGLLIDGIRGDLRIPVTALTPDEVSGTFDVALLAVKAQHTASALEVIDGHLAADGFVVSMQNGLGVKQLIATTIGSERTVGAMVRLGAGYREPGHITQLTPGIFVVGELDGRMTDRVEMLATLLSQVTPAQSTDNLWGWIWGKTVYIAFLAAVSVVDATYAEALSIPGAEDVALEAMRECARIAQAEGVRLEVIDLLDPNPFLGATPEDEARARREIATIRDRVGHTKSGILRDLVVRKIPLEFPSGPGDLLDRADKAGVPVPILRTAYRMLKEVEDGQRELSPANISELHSLLGVATKA
jgi:2-dehydropantoate 2-reductase